jgi:polar amino acid transport system substrate-binding protein
MQKSLKCLLAATVATALSCGVAAADTVRLGTEGAYAPFNFVNDKGEIDGFERELGDKLCEIAELECTWVKNDWDTIIPNLVSGNYDVIVAGMSITPERDETIDFTQDYYPPDPSSYLALAGTKEEAIGGVVAAQTATIQASYVTESGATLVEFATPDETIAAVKNGEADAVLADSAFLKPYVDESGGDLVFVGPKVQIGGGVGMGFRESDSDLKAKFDAAIEGMKKDGSLNELIAKWFDGFEANY